MMNYIKRWILPFTLITAGVFLMYKPPADPDYGWHYKYGEYFFTNQHILTNNIFSYTNTSYPWINSYWLFDIILYFLEHTLSHPLATLVLSLVISTLIYFFVKKASTNKLALAIVFTLSTALISNYDVTIRPHFYSSIFMFILFYILLYKQKYTPILPVIFLFWTNIHAEFVIGLFVFGVYTLNKWYLLICDKSVQKKFINFVNLSLPLIITALITLVNPHGINLWLTLIKELTLPVKSYVVEWTTMPVSTFYDIMSVGLIFAVYILGAIFYRSENNKEIIWYKFLVIFFFLFSLKASYMGRIVFITGTFGLTKSLSNFINDGQKLFFSGINSLVLKPLIPLTVILYTMSAVFFANKFLISLSVKNWSETYKYPYNAVAYIKNNKPTGNMFNQYNWGGYLIWQLPEYKTFIDGRMTSWRESNNHYFMTDYLKMIKKPNENTEMFTENVKKYNIGWIIDYPDSLLVKTLDNNKWQKVYEDSTSVIVIKKE
jgi:hypothetical protein